MVARMVGMFSVLPGFLRWMTTPSASRCSHAKGVPGVSVALIKRSLSWCGSTSNYTNARYGSRLRVVLFAEGEEDISGEFPNARGRREGRSAFPLPTSGEIPPFVH